MLSRKYRYLIALSREKHFGRAAATCHISPSTLSAAISDLENETGYVIVERGKQFAGFTPEGTLLVRYALQISDQIRTLQQELDARRGHLTGHLRIGVIPTALTAVATLSERFYRRHPAVTLEILSLSTTEILGRLTRFELDAGIIYEDEQHNEAIRLTPLWQEPHVLIMPTHPQWTGRQSISWKEASALPLCLLTADMKNRQMIDALFHSAGCTVQPQLESNSIISLLAHVATGAWASILPRSVIDMVGTPNHTLTLPLTEPTSSWKIGLATLKREPTPPLLTALITEAEQHHPSFG